MPSKFEGKLNVSQTAEAPDASYVLTLEEIGNLAAEGGKPAETLMNVVALIARRFRTDVCSAYLLEPDRANLVLAATLGLRPQCIGTLRMAVHEGLAGLVAEGETVVSGAHHIGRGYEDLAGALCSLGAKVTRR